MTRHERPHALRRERGSERDGRRDAGGTAPLTALHRAIDLLAMWTEDRVRRKPQPFRPAGEEPLRCWDELGPLPDCPAGPGAWRAPSPAPAPDDAEMAVRILAPRAAARGVALLVPPWKVGRARLVAAWERLLVRAGWESWLVVPPRHLERASGARSGEDFVGPDLLRARAAFEQLVLELRTLAAVAGSRGPVGVVGLSLGALGAALAATGGEQLAFAVLIAPPDLACSLERTPIGRRYRALAEQAGAPIPPLEALGPSLAPFSPALRPPRARRVFIAAGAHDAIVPAEAPIALARAWGAEARVYPRGHLTLLFGCRALRRDVATFLASREPNS